MVTIPDQILIGIGILVVALGILAIVLALWAISRYKMELSSIWKEYWFISVFGERDSVTDPSRELYFDNVLNEDDENYLFEINPKPDEPLELPTYQMEQYIDPSAVELVGI